MFTPKYSLLLRFMEYIPLIKPQSQYSMTEYRTSQVNKKINYYYFVLMYMVPQIWFILLQISNVSGKRENVFC